MKTKKYTKPDTNHSILICEGGFMAASIEETAKIGVDADNVTVDSHQTVIGGDVGFGDIDIFE